MTDDVSTAEMPPDLKKYLLVIIFANQSHKMVSMRAQIEFVPKNIICNPIWQWSGGARLQAITCSIPNNNEPYTWIKTYFILRQMSK